LILVTPYGTREGSPLETRRSRPVHRLERFAFAAEQRRIEHIFEHLAIELKVMRG